MKISEAWLREWVDPRINTAELVAQLTMAGLEVDSVEPAAAMFAGVIVGEILSAEPHPDAEKLRVCQVKGHAEGVLQVVCGAANARPGIKIPFATIGAELPGDFKIKKAKLRGVESFGMLCSQVELQIGEDDSGLWELPSGAPVGTDLRDYLKLDDQLIEIDLTPNRGDCLSIRGLAREVGVLNSARVSTPEFAEIKPTITECLGVEIRAGSECPVYAGRVIRNIDLSRPSPLWLREKLRRGGIRSIDAVVDVTNYVLLELGQPMHAFDLESIAGGIVVRMAEEGDKLTLLSDQEVELRNGTLVIADHEKPLAMAGIMGGADSAVGDVTRNIFLESAFFAPAAIAGKARSYGLHTDSSHRFERGVDHQLQVQALERATELLLNIVGGEAGPIVLEQDESSCPALRSVRLRKSRLESGLGLSVSDVDAVDILGRLGLVLQGEDDEGWSFQVPSYRFDLGIEEDLLEEIARVYGYDHLPTRPMAFATRLESQTEARTPLRDAKQHLVSRGYREVITYSFVDPKTHGILYPSTEAVLLKNPISTDMSTMRTSLLPGLLQTLLHNLNRQQTAARLFEAGMVFDTSNAGPVAQYQRLGGLAYGAVRAQNWAEKSRDLDFFDVKGDLETLLAFAARGRPVSFVPWTDASVLHPGQSARIFLADQEVGYVGVLHPAKQKALGLTKPAIVFELTLSVLLTASLPRFQSLSRFPEVGRDLAVLVDKGACVADIERSIRKSAGDALKALKLFDVYSGEGIDPKRKSLAFNLAFQHPSRTLKDEEVNASMAAVVDCLEREFGANLR
jgi:phenylalanyl-tRNA synthetase beta chain